MIGVMIGLLLWLGGVTLGWWSRGRRRAAGLQRQEAEAAAMASIAEDASRIAESYREILQRAVDRYERKIEGLERRARIGDRIGEMIEERKARESAREAGQIVTAAEFLVIYEAQLAATLWNFPTMRIVQAAEWEDIWRPEGGPTVWLGGRLSRPIQGVEFRPRFAVGVVLQ